MLACNCLWAQFYLQSSGRKFWFLGMSAIFVSFVICSVYDVKKVCQKELVTLRQVMMEKSKITLSYITCLYFLWWKRNKNDKEDHKQAMNTHCTWHITTYPFYMACFLVCFAICLNFYRILLFKVTFYGSKHATRPLPHPCSPLPLLFSTFRTKIYIYYIYNHCFFLKERWKIAVVVFLLQLSSWFLNVFPLAL